MDPEHGGLVVYDHLADATAQQTGAANDGGFGLASARDWAGRANVTVPYKGNRMVLFDSSLYHRTDKLRFKPGYANRRINLTFLFGSAV